MATPIQTYYVPMRESDLILDFEGINSGQVDSSDNGYIRTLIAIAVAAPGTVIWYDHWEDGYDLDYVNAPGSSTSVWGDGIAANNFPGASSGLSGFVTGLPAGDVFAGGESIILENPVKLGDIGTTFAFDGGDRIVVSFPVTVVRAAYPTNNGATNGTPGSLLAGDTEVFATDRYGTTFVAPVGENTGIFNFNDTDPFELTSIHVMASVDNTEVFLNSVSQGFIDAGESIRLTDIDQGDVITATNAVQANIFTGDVGSSYESRSYALSPRDQWSDDYYTPVFGSIGGNATRVWLYNPNNVAIEVTMSVAGNPTAQIINIPAGGSVLSNGVPNNSGARFHTTNANGTDGDFYAITQTDTTGAGETYDWGHPLIPADQLTSQALVGLGYGNTPNSSAVPSYSVVWVTATQNATLFVDFDGNGTADRTIAVNALQGVKIADNGAGSENDQNMSGATIWATDANGDPVDIAVAWGQDPAVVNNQPNSLDMGSAVLPLPELTAGKSVALAANGDKDGDGQVDPGDVLEWTITILNFGRVDVAAGGFNIVDPITGANIFNVSDYVAGSTVYTYNNGTNFEAIADDGGFPLDGAGFTNTNAISGRVGANPGETQTIKFKTIVKDFADLPDLTTSVINTGALRVGGEEVIRFDANAPIRYEAKIDIEKFTNGVDADTPTGPFITPGDPVTWTYHVSIPDPGAGTTFLKDIVVTDSESGVTPVYDSGDDGDGILEYGETWVYKATGVAVAGQYANTGTATGTASYANGATVADVANPVDTDDSHYFGAVLGVQIEKTASVASVSAPGTVTYSYEVTNTGNAALSEVVVTDDNATPGAGDDFSPDFVGGDTDGDGKLDVGETWTYQETVAISQAQIDAGAAIVNV
ncbi:hypothetical protein, partial [Amaricoccus sp.]|uniref:DUF7507 domain-containing protein n=1 Tax=Amaricoccus sp. TaxID=1872485 RepID=UPI001B49D037